MKRVLPETARRLVLGDRHGPLWPWIGLAVFLAVTWSPLLVLVPDALTQAVQQQAFSLALPGDRTAGLLVQSLAYAASVAVAAALLGLAAAVGLCRGGPPPAWVLSALPALALIPPAIQALGWMHLGSVAHGLARAAGFAFDLPQGWGMAGWVQTLALLPVAAACALVGIQALDARLLDAARLQADDGRVFWTIVVPLARPMVLAGGALAFLQAFLDHGLPSLFGCNVYALEVFAEFAATHSAGRAFLTALPMLPFAGLAVVLGLVSLGRAGQISSPPSQRTATLPLSPALHRYVAAPGRLLLVVQALVPTLALAAVPGAWTRLPETFAAASQDMVFTFATALAAAATVLPLCLAAAWLLAGQRRRRPHPVLWPAVFIPLAVPASLTGVGLASLSAHAPWSALADAGAMPWLAGLARFLPLAVIVVLARLREVEPELFDAARVLGPLGPRFGLRLLAPLTAGGCLAGAGLVFALCVGELGAAVLVCPPGFETLAIRIFNYLHYGATDTAAGLCLLAGAVTTLGGLGGVWAWKRLRFAAVKPAGHPGEVA